MSPTPRNSTPTGLPVGGPSIRLNPSTVFRSASSAAVAPAPSTSGSMFLSSSAATSSGPGKPFNVNTPADPRLTQHFVFDKSPEGLQLTKRQMKARGSNIRLDDYQQLQEEKYRHAAKVVKSKYPTSLQVPGDSATTRAASLGPQHMVPQAQSKLEIERRVAEYKRSLAQQTPPQYNVPVPILPQKKNLGGAGGSQQPQKSGQVQTQYVPDYLTRGVDTLPTTFVDNIGKYTNEMAEARERGVTTPAPDNTLASRFPYTTPTHFPGSPQVYVPLKTAPGRRTNGWKPTTKRTAW